MLWFSQSLILLSLSLTLKSCFSCCIQEKNAILIFIIEWLLYNFCWCFLFLGKHATVMPWWENIAQLYPINHLIMAIKPIVIIALCWQGVLANSKVCWQMSWRINSVRLFVFIQVNFKFIQFMKKCFLWCWQLFIIFENFSWSFEIPGWVDEIEVSQQTAAGKEDISDQCSKNHSTQKHSEQIQTQHHVEQQL